MGVTDCHVHINPVWEMHPSARALLGHRGSGQQIEAFARSPERFLEYLDERGVERAVLVNYVAPEIVGYTAKANDFVLDFVRADPDRLVAVGGVLPGQPEPGRELERLSKAGLRGIKLHPPHQLFDPADYRRGRPGLAEIYEACERLRLPIIFHTGTSVFPGARNRFADPMRIEDVAIDYPKLTIVLAHGGRPLWMRGAAFLARRFERVFLELSSIPPTHLLDYFPDLERLAPKSLFGSDWPGPGVEDLGKNLAAFRALPISPEARTAMLERNPEVVFPRAPST